jgi:tetratricopeptide (TPR) repeat protein
VLKLLAEEEKNSNDVRLLFHSTYHNRGLAHVSSKRLTSAVQDFERAISYLQENEIADRGLDTVYQLARANHEYRDFNQAIDWYRRVVSINSSYSQASYFLGHLLYDKGQFKEAISSFNKAIAKDTNDHISLFNRGMCYDQLEKHVESKTDFENVIKLNANFSKAYVELAKCLYKSEGEHVDSRRILELFEKAAELSITDEQITKQESARIFFDRGVLLNNHGIQEEAIDSFTQAIQLDSKLLDAYFNRGIIYREMNDFELALVDFDQVLVLDPCDVGALTERGLIFLRTNHLERALNDFLLILQINPNSESAQQLIDYTQEVLQECTQ